MVRSAAFVLLGNAVISLLSLARNLIIAKLLPIADYGIASTFLIVLAVVDMLSQLGLQQQIVQSDHGSDPRFQAALQGFHVLRGVIAGMALFLLAGPIANFLNLPDFVWAYQAMACVPVLYALIHFDVYRLSREMMFGPMILIGFIPVVVSLLAVWPLTVWLGDYRVALYVLILQAVLTMAMSHVVAQRCYRLVLDLTVMKGALQFGWPLLVNGLLLFLIFQGDKALVGRELGVEMLAIFAMGFTLTLTPMLVVSRAANTFFLPQVAAVKHDPVALQRMSTIANEACLLLAVLFVAVIALIGKPVVHFLLGDKFLPLLPILVWLAMIKAVRIAKTGPAVVTLAVGRTEVDMIANFVRVLSLPVTWYALVAKQDIMIVLWILITAELLAYAVALYLMTRQVGISISGVTLPLLIAAAVIVIVGFDALRSPDPAQPELGATMLWIVLTFLLVALVGAMGHVRCYFQARGRADHE